MMDLPANWQHKKQHLRFTIECKDFKHALALINSVGNIAEELNHHPDISLTNYNHLVITTTTHSAGTLTQKDYELARKISEFIARNLAT